MDGIKEPTKKVRVSLYSRLTARKADFYSTLLRQVDYLSFLPPELLDGIFDLAYTPEYPPKGPLSKRLLPWYIDGLYRRISLRKDSNIVNFVEKINSKPALGELVRSLRLSGTFGCRRTSLSPIPVLDFRRLFTALHRLEILELDNSYLVIFENLSDILSFISSANLLSLLDLRLSYSALDCDWIPKKALVTLDHDHDSNLQHYKQLPHLSRLTISRPCTALTEISSFCALCPKLSDLQLIGLAPRFAPLLSELRNTELVHLELVNEDDRIGEYDARGRDPCDHLLPRFTSLVHLSIGDDLFSPDLPTHLSRLHSLQVLELGLGKIRTDDFLRLLSGPTRLPSLRKLVLHLIHTWAGEDFRIGEDGSAEWYVPEDGYVAPPGWKLPEFDEAIGFTVEGIERLVRLARSEDIKVEGEVFHGLSEWQEYLVNIANIAVWRCFKGKNFKHLHHLRRRYPHLCSRLPPLDLNSLDPHTLKLEYSLTREGWEMWTLIN